ncbi:MAG: FAD-dependent oxidoreductase, partial [Bacteroidales bacterium]|nr:FAD-dependent oxidoreductase [Bacteroidales bacterium]
MLMVTAFLMGMPACQPDQEKTISQTIAADVVIYGGTSAAVMAAVQVANMGKKVVVVSPDKHLGGLSASGLGWTDTGDKSVIGGL